MKFFIFSTLLFSVSVAAISCSSKRSRVAGGDDNDSYSQELKKYYYTDLQIVTETSPEGNCPDSQKLTDQKEVPSRISLSPQREIELKHPVTGLRLFGANVTLQVLGFDQAQYTFGVIDQYIPPSIPFQMKIRRIPGNLLELTFLDQVVAMKLTATPNYTFTAKEKRGECTLNHQVNVFGENAGYYTIAD